MSDQSPKPKSIVEAVLGEQTARTRELAQQIALRQATDQARHDRIRNVMSTVLVFVSTAAILFGLAMGCLALWNAVVR